MKYASIDRLTIVGFPTEICAFNDFLKKSRFFSPNDNIRPFPYAHSYSAQDGTLLQMRDVLSAKPSPLRIDFNPNHAEEDEVASALGLFERSCVTRVDIALDYAINPENFDWTVPAGVSYQQYYGRNHSLKSREIGGKKSLKKWRIYTKRDRSGKIPCRVEAQTRYPGSDLLRMNMFQGIMAVNVNLARSFREQATLLLLKERPHEIANLARDTQRKYRVLQASVAAKSLKPQPQDLYSRERCHLLQDLDRWLNYVSSYGASQIAS